MPFESPECSSPMLIELENTRAYRPIFDYLTDALVLALVLGPGEFDGNVGHVIPRVVDANEQEQHRSRSDDEQCRHRITWEHHRRDEEGGVGDQRQDRMPQPVFQYRLI